MRGKAMPQDVWIYLFLDARSLGSLFAGVPRCFRIDRLTTTVPAIAWKQPFAGFSRQAAPVLAQFFRQFWAESCAFVAFSSLVSSAVLCRTALAHLATSPSLNCFRQLDLAPFDLLFWPHPLVIHHSAPGRSGALRRP